MFLARKEHGPQRGDRNEHVQLKDGRNNPNTWSNNGEGGPDKKLSPSYKGPCTLECGIEKLQKLEHKAIVQNTCINLLLIRPKYLSTLTMLIISF